MPPLPHPQQERFAACIAAGQEATAAYLACHPRAREASAPARSAALLRQPAMQQRIAELSAAPLPAAESPITNTDTQPTTPAPSSDPPILTLAEKRRMLAQISRISLADMLDLEGNVDMEKVRRTPAWCLQEVNVTRKERTDRSGNVTTDTLIRLKAVDRLKALQLDAELESDAKPTAAAADTPSAEAQAESVARARALLRTLAGHGGHLLGPLPYPPERESTPQDQ